ncbi:MAG: choice-of-anchor tandem repeat NxxGxxAF-containing protein [Pseudomonadota bacterium]
MAKGILSVTAVAFLVVAATPATALTLNPIAATGSAAGGTGQTFTGFSAPKINDTGQTAFVGNTTPDSSGNDEGLFLGAPTGGTTTTAFEGDTAGGTGQTFTSFFDPQINGAGQTAFLGFTTSDSSGNNEGVFLGAPTGGTATIAFEGDAAGSTGQTFTLFNPPQINAAGQTAFRGPTTPDSSGNNEGLFLGAPAGGTTTVAFEGDAAGGTGQTFFRFNAPQINDTGQTAFFGFTTPDGSFNDRGIFLGAPTGGTTTVAFEGDAAGGTGQTFTDFNAPQINNAGQTAFFGSTTPDSSGNDRGVFLGALIGGTTTIAFEGDAAGGTGQTFTGFSGTNVEINAAGQTAFVGDTTPDSSGNDSGVFLGAPSGGTTTIAFEGDAAGSTGRTFTGFIGSDIEINDTGQVAFLASTAGGSGLFATDMMGNILDVLLFGDTVTDATGTQRIVSNILSFSLSDFGIAMEVSFGGGGEGIFVAAFDQLEPVPLPPAAFMLLAGLGGLAAFRRRAPRQTA